MSDKGQRVWASTDFTGYNPVGSAAVVIARYPGQAAKKIRRAVESAGLPASDFSVFEIKPGAAVILNDGDY